MYRHVGLNDTWNVLLGTLTTLGRIALSRLCSAQGRFVAASLIHRDKRKSERGEAVLTGGGLEPIPTTTKKA